MVPVQTGRRHRRALGLNELLVGGVGHEQFVFLLAIAVPPRTVLIDKVDVADLGQALRIGEPHCHGGVVCRVPAIRRTA
jgi:hypothetical protein